MNQPFVRLIAAVLVLLGAQTSAAQSLAGNAAGSPAGATVPPVPWTFAAPAASDAETAAPSYDDYFPALGYSFSHGLFARQQLTPLAIGSAASLALVPVDRKVSDALRGRAEGFGRAGNVIGSPLMMGAVSAGLIAGSLATDDGRFRGYAFALSQGLIVAGSVATAAKLAVRRTRPNGDNRRSFPSGHAAATFALATVSSHYYGKKAGIPLYALAGAVALSRVTSGKHYPSDVAAGATLGYIAGRAAILGAQHVTLSGGGGERGAGLRIYFTF